MRRALYICAWAVLRTDGDLCDFYKRLRGRGKPGKVAVTAVARKLLMQLNAVARRGTPWVKQHTNNRPSYQARSGLTFNTDTTHLSVLFPQLCR